MDARVTRESGNGTKRRRIELPLGVTLRRTTVLRDGRLTGDSGSAEDLNGMSRDSSSTISPHKRIRAELGFAPEEARDIEALLQQGYRGSRYFFGYPACPNLADQRPLLALLHAEEIGVSLTEEHQLDPEPSTSAIVVTHPQAKYFSV
jgi:hypothetical protein